MKHYIRHIPSALLINAPLIVYVVARVDHAYLPMAQDSIVFLITAGIVLSLSIAATTWAIRLIHVALHSESEQKASSRLLAGNYILREQTIHYQGA